MTHRQHYVQEINGKEYHLYCDTLPEGTYVVTTTKRTHKIARRKTGPNYDPNDANSILAAMLYAEVHETCLTMVWQHLYDHRGESVRGTDLRPYGDAWRSRCSELTDKYGWPIERRSPDAPGVWWYRMMLSRPRLVRLNGRRYDNGQDPTGPASHVRRPTRRQPDGDVQLEDVPVHDVGWVDRGRFGYQRRQRPESGGAGPHGD